MGPIILYARLRTQAEALDMFKVWKTKGTAIVPMLAMGQRAMIMRVPSPIFPGTRTTYWNLQWEFQWVGSITSGPWVGRKYSVSGGTLSS